MSPVGIASSIFGLVQSGQSIRSSQSTLGASTLADGIENNAFSSSLAWRVSFLQAQSVNSLLGSTSGSSAFSPFDILAATQSSSTEQLFSSSASGLNPSLFDSGSAFRMMSIINNSEVMYKAQYSELSEMKTAVSDMQKAGEALSDTTASMDNEAIKTQLQSFADKYNAWINRFDGSVKNGGLLAGTQAAEISLYELEQSVNNVFNGSSSGFHGLRDIGFNIDQGTNRASIDLSRLDSVLATSKTGVVNTLSEFGQNFSKSAELLNSDNNFIPNRLDNLDRVIDYLGEHLPSLQAEFGMGNPAHLTAQTAKALASYNRVFEI